MLRSMPDQTEFTTALLNPDLPVPEGIIQPDGEQASRRFDVYRNNVVTSLIGAMGDAFPIVKTLVGEKFFDAMAGHFVRSHPPKSPLMMFYGAEFPDFLTGFEPVEKLPYLADVARLEHARRLAYHATDDPVAPPDALAQIPEEKLGDIRIKLHASTHVIASEFPVFSIWRFNATDDKTPIAGGAETSLVCRPKDEVQMHLLPTGGGAFLEALSCGRTLGEAAEITAETYDDFDLGQNIGGLIAAQLITAIEQQ